MCECQPGRVQRLPSERTQNFDEFIRCSFWQLKPAAVDRIAQKRISAVRKMHTYLVRSAGLKLHAYIGVRPKPFQHAIMAHRRFAVIANRHLPAICGMPPKRCVNRSPTGQHAVAYREIVA